MNKFIRGLNDLDKLNKVLTCMDYNKYDDGFYTLSTAKLKRKKGHYIYIENGKKLIIKKDDHRFTLLKDKSKEEIEKWYLENK